ncbi:MAG: pseudaminic acid synthase, partial [Gottschalkiaceae bacterium]
MKKGLTISNKTINENSPTFIIAEISANHLQNFEIAAKIIEEVKKAGADAVKLQTYTPDTITIDCDNEHFKVRQGTIWDGTTLHKLYQEAYTPWEWQPKLKKIAEEEGLIFFSSPFDITAVDFLEDMNVPAYKIASFEINDIPFIEYIASKGKPIIMSTGIATLADIEEA